MKFLIKAVFLFLVTMNITSCSTYKTSPGISFRNYSDDYINNIDINWNSYRLPSKIDVPRTPGSSFSFNLVFRKYSDLFGPVHIEWENAKKEKIVKDFIFTKEQMPNFSYKRNGHVSFYLTQDDLIMFADPHEQLYANEEERKISKTAGQIERDLSAICPPEFLCKDPEYKSSCPSDCKSLMPIYQPSNMPKISKARQIYEEQEKQRLKNVEEYQKRKIKH